MIRENSILLEAYRFSNVDEAYNAIQTKKLGVKVNPNFLVNPNEEGKVRNLKNLLFTYFGNARKFNISDPTYGVQFLISHTSNINELARAVTNDGIYTYLQNYKKPWVKQLPSYNDFVNKSFDANNWHKLEKEIQDNLENHGKSKKGGGIQNDVKILYPKDANGWELKIPLSFAGSKAAAFYGKEGEEQKPTHWCTRASESYYNHYTNDNKFPLYIIRNYKTGKAYQMSIAPSDGDNNKLDVFFLDQDDVNGDEITNGDLSKIPDNLLKLIKFGNRNLLSYKNAPAFAKHENEKGFTNKETTFKKEAKKVPEKFMKEWLLDNQDVVERYGEPMYQVGSNGHHSTNGEDDESPIKQFFNGKNSRVDFSKKEWLRKAGSFKLFFSKYPENSIVCNISRDYALTFSDDKTLNRVMRDALQNLFIDFKNNDFHKNERNENTTKSWKERNKKIANYLDERIKKEFPDYDWYGEVEVNYPFPAYAAFLPSILIRDDMKTYAKFEYIQAEKKYDKEIKDIRDIPNFRQRVEKIVSDTNRYARNLYSYEIMKSRKEGRYPRNGIYESIENFLNNLQI